MDWLEQNLDAYRIIAEILQELRANIHRELKEAHGEEWCEEGLPGAVFERLVETKEHELSIDWYDHEYQELISFTTFTDLFEILNYNPDVMPQLSLLAPGPTLLQARFFELEAVRKKLASARPISEAEVSLIGTFHVRFRKALASPKDKHKSRSTIPTKAEPRSAPVHERIEVEVAEAEPAPAPPPPPARPSSEPKPAAQPARSAAKPAKEAAAATNPGDKTRPVEKETEDTQPEAPTAKTQPIPTSLGSKPVVPPGQKPSESPPPKPEPEKTTPSEKPEAQPEKEARQDRGPLGTALTKSDHKAILRELYREVTEIAEGLWTSDVMPAAAVWNAVRVSPWYENNFSKLGLKPLSDFYDIIDKVDSRMEEGIAKDQLQAFLKECNFAHVLLSLRDMFQKNQI